MPRRKALQIEMICNFLNTRFYSITVLCGFNTISDFCDILKESIHEIYFLITWRIFITNDSLLTANHSVSASDSAQGRYEPVLVLWLKEKRVRGIFLYFWSNLVATFCNICGIENVDDENKYSLHCLFYVLVTLQSIDWQKVSY